MDKALLLIDDEEEFRDTFKITAQRKGFRLAWGRSYEDMIEKLPLISKQIVAIVLDIKCLISNEEAIEDEGFIMKALLFLQYEYKELPRLILTGDDKALDFARFSKDELVFTKDRESIEKLFKKVQEYAVNHPKRIQSEDEREFFALIRQDEGRKLEFKASLQFCINEGQKKKELRFEVMKAIAAFSNSEGGSIFIGVKDNKEIYGLENGDFQTMKDNNKIDEYRKLIDDLIQNEFGNGFQRNMEDLKFYNIAEKTVCKISIKGKYSSPCYVNKPDPKRGSYKAFFVRGTASSRELKEEKEIKDYIGNSWIP